MRHFFIYIYNVFFVFWSLHLEISFCFNWCPCQDFFNFSNAQAKHIQVSTENQRELWSGGGVLSWKMENFSYQVHVLSWEEMKHTVVFGKISSKRAFIRFPLEISTELFRQLSGFPFALLEVFNHLQTWEPLMVIWYLGKTEMETWWNAKARPLWAKRML